MPGTAADCLENTWLPAVTSPRLPMAFPWIIMVGSYFFYITEVWKCHIFTLQTYGKGSSRKGGPDIHLIVIIILELDRS